jgi:hypothetical protein
MAKHKQLTYFQMKDFSANIRKILNTLPSEAEKKEIQSNIDAIVNFLNDMRKNIVTIPSSKNMSELSKSLQAFEELHKKAETNTILANVFGIHRPKAKKSKKFQITEEESLKANKLLSELESIPIEQIRSRLQSDNLYSVSDLRALASVMGIRSIEKQSKETLVHQITMKIANFRGYKQLSGEIKA